MRKELVHERSIDNLMGGLSAFVDRLMGESQADGSMVEEDGLAAVEFADDDAGSEAEEHLSPAPVEVEMEVGATTASAAVLAKALVSTPATVQTASPVSMAPSAATGAGSEAALDVETLTAAAEAAEVASALAAAASAMDEGGDGELEASGCQQRKCKTRRDDVCEGAQDGKGEQAHSAEAEEEALVSSQQRKRPRRLAAAPREIAYESHGTSSLSSPPRLKSQVSLSSSPLLDDTDDLAVLFDQAEAMAMAAAAAPVLPTRCGRCQEGVFADRSGLDGLRAEPRHEHVLHLLADADRPGVACSPRSRHKLSGGE